MIAAIVAAIAVPAAAAPPAPLFEYPTDTRAAGGGPDPFKTVPAASDCSAAKDHAAGGFTPLSQLTRRPADNPFVTGDRGSVVAIYVNKKRRQTFKIYLSATTPAILKNFIATSTACLEAFPLSAIPGAVVQPVPLAAILVQDAVKLTGSSQAALATIRDQLVAQGHNGSLGDVITKAGGDPAAVAAAAAPDASAALAAKVTAGDLTSTEVEALNVPGVFETLVALPGAPFLYDPINIPPGTPELSTLLRKDPKGIVVVGTVPVEPMPGKLDVIWYAFDPTFSIANGWKHYFVNQCHPDATAGIYSWQGDQWVALYRMKPSYTLVGQKEANGNHPDTGAIKDSAVPKSPSYDAAVWATAHGGGKYSIYGAYTWVMGSNVAC
jgi:hypothetical protein